MTDFFIVNVAFPSIQADLHASSSAIEWVVAGYGLTYASFLIMAGRIGDHIGRRRLLTAGLLLFVLSSAGCGVAPGPALLVAARLVPTGIAALSLIRRLVPESRAQRARRLDPVGMTLVTLALATLVLPLVEGPQMGWPTWTWLCLGLAAPLVTVFLAHQSWLGRRGGDPLIELDLFRRRSLAVGLATQLGLWCSMASFFLVLALYLQHGRGRCLP